MRYSHSSTTKYFSSRIINREKGWCISRTVYFVGDVPVSNLARVITFRNQVSSLFSPVTPDKFQVASTAHSCFLLNFFNVTFVTHYTFQGYIFCVTNTTSQINAKRKYKNIIERPDIFTQNSQKACDIYIGESQPVEFLRQKLLLRVSFIRNVIVLWNSGLPSLLCCDPGTEEVECPAHSETPSASLNIAGDVCFIHRSALTLCLVISNSLYHLRRNRRRTSLTSE